MQYKLASFTTPGLHYCTFAQIRDVLEVTCVCIHTYMIGICTAITVCEHILLNSPQDPAE